MSSITVNNEHLTEFDFKSLVLDTNYNIVIHCVYDLYNHFDQELEFLDKYLHDKNTVVILWHAVEMGMFDAKWTSKLNNIVRQAQCKIIYLSGNNYNINVADYVPCEFELKFFPIFDVRVVDMLPRPAPYLEYKQKKFMFLNSKDNLHRRTVLAHLHKNNLLDSGYVSYQCVEGKIQTNSAFLDSVNIPIYLDHNSVASKLPRHIPIDSYVNIIGETQFTNVPHWYTNCFVTEKTFTSMANYQMFIVVGQPHSLELVKRLGYKTFHGIINEDYDNIQNDKDRLDAVVQEIIRFVSRPIDEIRQDYARAKPILDHNIKLLYQQSLQKRFQDLINETCA